MILLFFLFIIGISGSHLQHKEPINPDNIPNNPAWRHCLGFKCDEGSVCVIHRSDDACGPVCVKAGEITCANVDCFSGLICIHEEVVCVRAPCYPVPKCVHPEDDPYLPAPDPSDCSGGTPSCPKGEIWNACGGCEGTCETGQVACRLICDPSKATCRCLPPLLRGPNGNCIEEKQCQTEVSPSYATPPPSRVCNLFCIQGNRCIITSSGPRCVPETRDCTPPLPSCRPGTVCQMVGSMKLCVQFPPPPSRCNPPCPPGNWACIDSSSGPVCTEAPISIPPPEGSTKDPIGQVPTDLVCGTNEVVNECGNACEATCYYVCNPPQFCPGICGKPACVCAERYFRNSAGQCVLKDGCLPCPSTTTTTTMAPKTYCLLQPDGRQKCVAIETDKADPSDPYSPPSTDSQPCERPCDSASHCQITSNGPKCIPGAECTPPLPPCPYEKYCTMATDGSKSCVAPPPDQPVVTIFPFPAPVTPTPKGPGPPGPQCQIFCPPGSRCEQTPSGPRCVPDVSPCTPPAPACPPGTQCQMSPDGRKNCVPIGITEPPPTCALISCPSDTKCVDTPTGPKCNPVKPTTSCANVRCAAGTHCIETPTGPQCVPDIPNCGIVPCPRGTTCQSTPTGPKCVPATCGDNEELNPCGNLCEGICSNKCQPVACPKICNPPACACKQNFYRDAKTKKCVPKEQCKECQGNNGDYAKVPTLTCANVLCAPGSLKCIETPTGPQCVQGTPNCGIVPCKTGTTCQNTPDGPMCVPNPPLNCGIVPCPKGTTCQSTSNGPRCLPQTCGPNEELSQCGNHCEGKCRNKCLAVPCLAICNPPACACKANFFRDDKTGQCVPKEKCIECNPPTLTCANVLCVPNYVCIETPTGPQCVPNPPNCGIVPCKAGTSCQSTPDGPRCVPVSPPNCGIVPCKAGTTCQNTPTGPRCIPVCGDNEEVSQCGNLCEGVCSNKCQPVACIEICNPPACACKQDFFRDSATKKCVPKGQCKECQGNGVITPKGPILTCATVLCITGTTCIETPTGPQCVKMGSTPGDGPSPNTGNPPGANPCDRVRCAGPLVCAIDEDTGRARCVTPMTSENPYN